MQLPTIAVVCATYNGEGKLPGLIASLEENLKNTIVNSEIIFVIDGSIDKSIAVLENFAKIHSNKKIKVIQNASNLGISESRNVGIVASESEFTAFLDDDCRPSPDWLTSLAKHWQEAPKETVGIGGFVIPSVISSFNQEFCAMVAPLRPMPLNPKPLNLYQRIKKFYAKPDTRIKHAEYLVGANMSFRKSALIEVDLFSSEIRFGGDDLDICQSLRNRYGNNCLSIFTTLEMKHEFPSGFGDSLRRSYRYGLGSGKNYWSRNSVLSFNPGPVLLLGLIALFVIFSAITTNSRQEILIYSLTFFLSELLIYALFVTRNSPLRLILNTQRFKLGFAFLICEFANNIGFISGISFLFSKRIK